MRQPILPNPVKTKSDFHPDINHASDEVSTLKSSSDSQSNNISLNSLEENNIDWFNESDF
jgi:hypothetical protein